MGMITSCLNFISNDCLKIENEIFDNYLNTENNNIYNPLTNTYIDENKFHNLRRRLSKISEGSESSNEPTNSPEKFDQKNFTIKFTKR